MEQDKRHATRRYDANFLGKLLDFERRRHPGLPALTNLIARAQIWSPKSQVCIREACDPATIAARVNRLFLSAGTALAFLLAAAFRWLTLTEFLNDHFDHVALAQQLRLGALPVRDFVDEGMPLMYAISAAAWSLINAPFLSEAIIVALAFAIAAALSFRVAARLSRSMLAAALAVIAQVAIFPRTYSYPKLLVQAVAIAVACWAVRNLTTRRIAALSAATALGYYFRHDHAVYLGVAIVTLLVIVQWPVGMRAVVRTLVLYAALAAAFVLPHLLYVQWAAGIPTYVAIARQYLSSEAASAPYQIPVPYLDTRAGLWIRRNAAPNNVRWAPSVDDQTREALEQRYHMDRVEHDEGTTWRYHIRDTSPANLRAIQNDPHVEDTDGFNRLVQARSWRSAWRLLQLEPGWRVQENSLAVLFWLSWLLPVAAIALLVARRRDHSTADAAVVAMLAVLAFFTDVAFLRAPLHVRLPDLAASHSMLAAWIGASLWQLRIDGLRRFFTRAIVVLATATVFMAIVEFAQVGQLLATTGILKGPTGVVARWREVSAHLHDDKPGPVPNNPSGLLLPFLEYLRVCTAPQDRLLFTWYSPDIYVVADRGFAGDHRRLYRPLSAWEQARTVARLQQERVPFVVIPLPRRQWLQESNPEIWRFIERRYVPMATIPPDDADGYEILRESAWTGTSVYPQTNWPCLR